MKSLQVLLAFVAILFASCAGMRVSGNGVRFHHKVEVICASAAGGAMSEAIVREMGSYAAAGIEVKSGAETIEILNGLGIAAIEAEESKNLKKLQSAGVDGFMRITTVKGRAGSDSPGRVTVRLYSTQELGSVIEFVWENAWGGAPGSAMDSMMRVNAKNAAKEIADDFFLRL